MGAEQHMSGEVLMKAQHSSIPSFGSGGLSNQPASQATSQSSPRRDPPMQQHERRELLAQETALAPVATAAVWGPPSPTGSTSTGLASMASRDTQDVSGQPSLQPAVLNSDGHARQSEYYSAITGPPLSSTKGVSVGVSERSGSGTDGARVVEVRPVGSKVAGDAAATFGAEAELVSLTLDEDFDAVAGSETRKRAFASQVCRGSTDTNCLSFQ